jgi:hypothetical protein
MRALLATLLLLAALAALPARQGQAQEEPSGTSYITPFPEGDIYRMQVYGDAFAEGLVGGLVEAFAGDARVQLPKQRRPIGGLIRPELEDELRNEEANRDTIHVAIVMVGYNDRWNMRAGPREWLKVGTDEWRLEYGKRADRLMKTLKKKGMAVYWVGQPVMRSPQANEPAQTMNDVVREKAYLNGVRYIDITAHFADEAGNFTAYGPDVAGKQRLVREADGVLFTWVGYRKLAHFVEREIKRDLTQARNDRAIPLAGTEAEQKRIAVQRPRPPDPDPTWKSSVSAAKDKDAKPVGQPKATAAQPAPSPPAIDLPGEQKVDNGRISLRLVSPGGREEVVALDLPRPAIPAAVVQLITRKETGERATQMGDVIADDVGGGLVVLSSVTPSATGPGGRARGVSPGQPYYQVWIKGERLPPKPGRADDFTWPRVDPDVAAEDGPARRPLRPAAPKVLPRS